MQAFLNAVPDALATDLGGSGRRPAHACMHKCRAAAWSGGKGREGAADARGTEEKNDRTGQHSRERRGRKLAYRYFYVESRARRCRKPPLPTAVYIHEF